MNLNLHILKEDLSKYNLSSKIIDDRTTYKISYPTLYSGEKECNNDCIYIAESSLLPANMNFDERPSFLCIGTPPDVYMTSNCNVLYTTDNVTPIELLNRILKIFQTYYNWEMSMQDINNRNLPLKELGIVSIDFFQNPLFLYDANFKTIFSITDISNFELPSDYTYPEKDNEFFDLDMINSLKTDKEFLKAASLRIPAVYLGNEDAPRTLFYNICVNDVYVARIGIDEICHPFNDKDFALIKIFGDYVYNGILRKDMSDFNRPKYLDDVLKKLLDHKLVDEQKIKTVLVESGWEMEDIYFCFLVEPTSFDKNNKTLDAVAQQLSLYAPGDYYIVHKDYIVFVFNLTKADVSRNSIIEKMHPLMRDSFLKAGISTAFTDFKKLYYYYRQALIALTLGKEKDPSFWFYRFEDYNLKYFIHKCQEELPSEILCPEGLKRLIAYDKKKGRDFTGLLRIFLENNMNIADTIRIAYLHRNTFLHRIERIKEILKMDLSDPDVRLLLIMSLKVIEKPE